MMENGRTARAERRSRNFGADAKPARKRKPQYGNKGEMGGKKGPIRERGGGQIFSAYEDDGYSDDDQDLDILADFRETDEEDVV